MYLLFFFLSFSLQYKAVVNLLHFCLYAQVGKKKKKRSTSALSRDNYHSSSLHQKKSADTARPEKQDSYFGSRVKRLEHGHHVRYAHFIPG